ncbi:hypothetical protein LSAT2_016795 [Lamellibrachia satsuma]|nr:hypothetical protein LSAT2_016795 [Lamellibrachia satsuma]
MACETIPCFNNATCRYVGGEDEFTCDCLTGFLGDRCQFEQKPNEAWTHCGETHLTSDRGVISSPLYPRMYPPNVNCAWLVETGANHTVLLTLMMLDVESTKRCMLDALSVHDGNSTDDPVILGPACGQLSAQQMAASKPIMSSGNQVLVTFRTDDTVAGSGFQLSYEQERCGLGRGESGCGTPSQFSAECGTINVTRGPNSDAGDTCEWTIAVQDGHIVNVTVSQFHMADTGQDCIGGHLSIYGGGDDTAPLIGQYCGERFPWTVFSRSNRVYMRLQLSNPRPVEEPRIHIQYAAVDPVTWRLLSEPIDVHGRDGNFSTSTTDVHVRARGTDTYKWRVRVPVGDLVSVDWMVSGNQPFTLQIFDGYSEESGLLLATNWSRVVPPINGTVTGHSFQVVVVLSAATGSDVSLDVTFHAVHVRTCPELLVLVLVLLLVLVWVLVLVLVLVLVWVLVLVLSPDISSMFRVSAWTPHLSGCYRPLYYRNTTSGDTENAKVSRLQPVTLVVSDNALASAERNYDAGLYCKWLVESEPGTRLSLRFLNVDIKPLLADCRYDGLVVYDGGSTSGDIYGPFCGSSSISNVRVNATQEKLLVVFYSDKRGPSRSNGVMRALVTSDAIPQCPTWQMEESFVRTIRANCGVLLSPNFPGLVGPGLWSWTLQAPVDAYLVLHVYYVRGPAASQSTGERLRVLEISHDATELRQYEAPLLTLDGNTDLFIPEFSIKAPPNQKMVIELDTITTSIPHRWEFKMSFSIDYMAPPKDPLGAVSIKLSCPENYLYFGGNCYRYYQWVLRHYRPEDYRFQESWHKALRQCERENATLASIHSEEEAYFIKYTMSKEWFWNPAATFQLNHRLILIGLHNKHGDYKWTDGSRLGYADWYEPPPDWSQSALHEDSIIKDLLNLKYRQPSASFANLCTVLVSRSPHGSLNWAKVPCDYPMFQVGLLCKRPAHGKQVCPGGWIKTGDTCFMLHTNYNASNLPNFTYNMAESVCKASHSHVSLPDTRMLNVVKMYLNLWRHSPATGDVWLGREDGRCRRIRVYRRRTQEEEVLLEVSDTDCEADSTEDLPQNVLCERSQRVYMERCGSHEFRCLNEMCISADFVCDGVNDCLDNSDELGCDCTSSNRRLFQCDNGKCISMSLYCDFRDDCGDLSDEKHCENQCKGFLCYSGKCVNPRLQHDFWSDCPGLAQEDEYDKSKNEIVEYYAPVSDSHQQLAIINVNGSNDHNLSYHTTLPFPALLTLSELDRTGKTSDEQVSLSECTRGGSYVQCRNTPGRCYDRASACVYDTEMVEEATKYTVQASCRDGAHLRMGCGDAECGAGMYHCPASFCIPYRKICDDVIDCPGGEDELDCHNYTCPGLLKCRGVSVCLSHGEVCDGVSQCPVFKEDEKYCDHTDVICESCQCVGFVADCRHSDIARLSNSSTTEQRRLRALLLANNTLEVTTDSFRGLHWLGRLELRYNGIEVVPEGAFRDLLNLRELDLSWNQLQRIDAAVFLGLKSLRTLDLSHNRLVTLRGSTFSGLPVLERLSLTDNSLQDVAIDTFKAAAGLKELATDAFKFCCIALDVANCSPQPDEFSSCEDLMANPLLQVSIWVLGISAFLGNLFVIVWRIRTDASKASSFFVINLGCSDFLMGLYLLIIGSVDAHYRGVYIVHADSWRSSNLCQAAGFLAMLSSEVSVFMLTVMTIERLLTIMYPLQFGHMRLKHARLVTAAGWFVCVVLSAVPMLRLSYFGDAFFGSTGVCLPFTVSSVKTKGWEYSVVIFLVVNLVSFLIICFGYLAIFVSVRSQVRAMAGASTASMDEYKLAKRLALIVVTDFLCWVPIILIGFAALGGVVVPPQVSAWIAVFALPLNSAVNPLLYTISAINCRNADTSSSVGLSLTVTDDRKTTVSTV